MSDDLLQIKMRLIFTRIMAGRGRVTSGIWYHFSKLENGKGKCRYCHVLIAMASGSSANLKRHLKTKHPMVPVEIGDKNDTSNTASETVPSSSQKPIANIIQQTSTMNTEECARPFGDSNATEVKQPFAQKSMTNFVEIIKPLSVQKQRSIDVQLLKTICKEYHPLSLVEGTEFKKFVNLLCPSYTLPSRKTLTYSLMPTVYEDVLAKVKADLDTTLAVSITCDGWTSSNNEGYYAVTAHFLDKCVK